MADYPARRHDRHVADVRAFLASQPAPTGLRKFGEPRRPNQPKPEEPGRLAALYVQRRSVASTPTRTASVSRRMQDLGSIL